MSAREWACTGGQWVNVVHVVIINVTAHNECLIKSPLPELGKEGRETGSQVDEWKRGIMRMLMGGPVWSRDWLITWSLSRRHCWLTASAGAYISPWLPRHMPTHLSYVRLTVIVTVCLHVCSGMRLNLLAGTSCWRRLRVTNLGFLSARRYDSADITWRHVSFSVSVCHTAVLCQNGCTDRAAFFAYRFPITYATLYC